MTTPERRGAALKRYRERHKAQIRACNNRAHNRGGRREYNKRWMINHPDKAAEYRRKYRAKRLAYNRAWLARNPGYMRRWYKTHRGKRTEYSRTKRAKRRGISVEQVNLGVVAARDGWTCGICGLAVSKGEESLDHVIPIARGGRHSYSNVQLAHNACNSKKGTRILPRIWVLPASEVPKPSIIPISG